MKELWTSGSELILIKLWKKPKGFFKENPEKNPPGFFKICPLGFFWIYPLGFFWSLPPGFLKKNPHFAPGYFESEMLKNSQRTLN